MLKKKFILTLVLASMIAGCGRNDSDSKKPNAEESPNLAGKSAHEVLNLKYKRATLKCSLWVQRKLQLDTSAPPADVAAIDLRSNPDFPTEFFLEARLTDHVIQAKLTLNSIEILDGLTYRDNQGQLYTLEKTPKVNLELNFKSRTTFAPGVYSAGGGKSKQEVYEGMNTEMIHYSAQRFPESKNGVIGEPLPLHNYLGCTIDTDVQPQYRDQFKRL